MKEQPALPFSIKPFQGPTLVHVLLFKNKKQQQQQNTTKQINPQTFKCQKCCFLKTKKKFHVVFIIPDSHLGQWHTQRSIVKLAVRFLGSQKNPTFHLSPCCGQRVWNEPIFKAHSKTNHFGIFWVKLWPGCTYPVHVACVLGRYEVYEQRIMESSR